MKNEIPTPRTDQLFNLARVVSIDEAKKLCLQLEHEIYHLSKSLDREIAINLDRSHELGLMESAARLAREAIVSAMDNLGSFEGRHGYDSICEGSMNRSKEALSALDAVLPTPASDPK